MAESYTPHSLPILGAADLIRSTAGDNLRQQINAVATAADTAITAEGVRAEGAANDYTDSKDAANRSAWASADTATLASANSHTDTEISVVEETLPRKNADGAWRVTDKTGAVALAVTPDGDVQAADTLMKPLHGGTGYVYAITDLLGRIAFGVKADGSTTVDPRTLSDDGPHRKQELLRRKGGAIGTAGKGVVALRFDHQNPDFQSKVLPLLQARGLPYTHAQYVNALGTQENGYAGDVQTGMTWAQVESACLNSGGEVFSHSWSHGDVSGTAGLRKEIVESRGYLETQMPNLFVEGFAQPGIAGAAWDGFALDLGDPNRWRAYEAGRMIRDTYAVYTGGGSLYWPLTGDASDGVSYYNIDNDTASTSAKNLVDAAVSMSVGTVLMLHSNNVDAAGKITTAILTEILDYVAAQRDAGTIEVLTVSGLLCATPAHGNRHNLLQDSQFAQFSTTWQNTTGWSATAGVASTTTGGLILRNVSVSSFGWALGGARQGMAEFRAPAGAVVRVRVYDYNNPALLDTSIDVTLPASTDWVKVRQPFVIPRTSTLLRLEIGRVSGGAVDVRNPGMFAL